MEAEMKKFASCLLVIPFLLSACAMQEGDFPSLSKRPFEDKPVDSGSLTDSDPVMQTLSGPLQNAVSASVRQSQTAHDAFLNDLADVEKAVAEAGGAAPSSESWVVAQMKLSSLEVSRSPSVSALADIDALYIERLGQELDDSQPGGAALIAQSRDRISGQVTAQQNKIDQLRASIR